MDVEQIRTRCGTLTGAMVEKGLVAPECELRVVSHGQFFACLSHQNIGAVSCYDRCYNLSRGDSPAEALDGAEAWIAEQPSMTERKRDVAVKLTAQAIEAAKEAGVDTDLLAPVYALMHRLSENIITEGEG